MVSFPVLFGLGLTGMACLAVTSGWVGRVMAPSLFALAAYLAVTALWGVLILRQFTGMGGIFPSGLCSVQSFELE